MKAVVTSDGRGTGGRLVENPEFRGFADHSAFRIRACRPYRAQTKGKVERPIGYVRSNFFHARDFVSHDDVNAQARRRPTERSKERVSDRFERERRLLGPMAPRPYTPVVPRPEPVRTRRGRRRVHRGRGQSSGCWARRSTAQRSPARHRDEIESPARAPPGGDASSKPFPTRT